MPLCNHHKPKLEVNLTENKEGKNPWHCWACDSRGTTLYNLFKQIKVDSSKFTELSSLVINSKSIKETHISEEIKLPLEYISLHEANSNDLMARHASNYLKNRNISKYDILKYNIGYCKEGLYKNMIIMPTYDINGKLNYFSARSFEKDPYVKYRNPSISRDIIPNEHFINWNVPIILCEGLFDAMAIKRNAIPLLGKNIQSSLMKKIVTSVVDKIYIILDKDAIKQALKFCEKLMTECKEVHLIQMDGKDPSEIGFENILKYLHTSKPLTFHNLMELKLEL